MCVDLEASCLLDFVASSALIQCRTADAEQGKVEESCRANLEIIAALHGKFIQGNRIGDVLYDNVPVHMYAYGRTCMLLPAAERTRHVLNRVE